MATLHTLVPRTRTRSASAVTVAHSSLPSRANLVEHEGRWFDFSELLSRAPEAALYAALRDGPPRPQDWWDAMLLQSPGDAARIVSQCQPRRPAQTCRIIPFRPLAGSGDRLFRP